MQQDLFSIVSNQFFLFLYVVIDKFSAPKFKDVLSQTKFSSGYQHNCEWLLLHFLFKHSIQTFFTLYSH